jgi:hypothetical protein
MPGVFKAFAQDEDFKSVKVKALYHYVPAVEPARPGRQLVEGDLFSAPRTCQGSQAQRQNE